MQHVAVCHIRLVRRVGGLGNGRRAVSEKGVEHFYKTVVSAGERDAPGHVRKQTEGVMIERSLIIRAVCAQQACAFIINFTPAL